MSEKKYIFKIDHSKAIEKFGRSLDTHVIEKATSSDFKVTCVNYLYYKETEVDADYKDNGSSYRMVLFAPDLYFTIVKSKNVIDIVKDEDGSVKIVKSNDYGDENAIAYFSDKNGNITSRFQNDERLITRARISMTCHIFFLGFILCPPLSYFTCFRLELLENHC